MNLLALSQVLVKVARAVARAARGARADARLQGPGFSMRGFNIYLGIYLSLSLSLYIYIYTYIHMLTGRRARYGVLHFCGCVFLQYVLFAHANAVRSTQFGAVAKPPLHKPPIILYCITLRYIILQHIVVYYISIL